MPEFKLYPNADNPWAPSDMDVVEAGQRREAATRWGLSATYVAENGTHTWTLTFGGEALAQIRDLTAEYTHRQFKIYSLVADVDGNQSGSMHDGNYVTTVVEMQLAPVKVISNMLEVTVEVKTED